MECIYCKKECEVYEVPSYHKNLYEAYECFNCKVPVIYTFEFLTKQMTEICFYLVHNDRVYEAILQLSPKITKLNLIDPDEDHNDERPSFKEFDYLLDITPDNFENKLETILTFL